MRITNVEFLPVADGRTAFFVVVAFLVFLLFVVAGRVTGFVGLALVVTGACTVPIGGSALLTTGAPAASLETGVAAVGVGATVVSLTVLWFSAAAEAAGDPLTV